MEKTRVLPAGSRTRGGQCEEWFFSLFGIDWTGFFGLLLEDLPRRIPNPGHCRGVIARHAPQA